MFENINFIANPYINISNYLQFSELDEDPERDLTSLVKCLRASGKSGLAVAALLIVWTLLPRAASSSTSCRMDSVSHSSFREGTASVISWTFASSFSTCFKDYF